MLLIGNGRLVTRDQGKYIENGAVAIDGNLIVEVGETAALKQKYAQAEWIDANGGVIMPGMINTHNHIYSSFARGLSINNYNPHDFNDILEGMWWKIDRLLTKENDRLSAYAVYIDCIKNKMIDCRNILCHRCLDQFCLIFIWIKLDCFC